MAVLINAAKVDSQSTPYTVGRVSRSTSLMTERAFQKEVVPMPETETALLLD